MTDTDKLKRLAEAATPGPWSAADWDDDFGENRFTVQATEPEKLSPGQSSIWPDGIRSIRVAETEYGQRPLEDAAFIAAANPQAILSLIAEIEALTSGGIIEVAVRNPSVADYVQHWEGRTERAERERDEAAALLREWCSVGNPMERGHCHNKTDAFLARIETKQQG